MIMHIIVSCLCRPF